MKKGISPLIATVLLIGFTIAMAALVSTFIIQQTQKFNPEEIVGESGFCDNVVLGVKINGDMIDTNNLDGEPEECGRGYVLTNLVLVNKGAFSITKLKVDSDHLGGFEYCFSGSCENGGVLRPGASDPVKREDGSYLWPSAFTPGICENSKIRIVPFIKVDTEGGEQEIACTQSETIINYGDLNIE